MTGTAEVALVSQRSRPDGYGRQPGYTAFVEAEDVLVEASRADLVLVNRNPTTAHLRLRRAAGRAYRRVMGSTRALPVLPLAADAGVERGRRRNRYDLTAFVGITIWDLSMLERLHELRRRSEQIVAWFPEVWVTELADQRVRREPFDLVDHLFVGAADSAMRLGEILNRPVHYLPMAVDAERFAPADLSQPRPLDVLGIGRRRPDLHQALLEWSASMPGRYLYDTAPAPAVTDFRAHREQLAATYRRASIAITHYAKFDQPEMIGHQREIPGRLWEALASGTVMVGHPPDPVLQRDWPGGEVVIPLPEDPRAAVELIDEITRHPRQERRRHQVRLALERNDWAHRWHTVFVTAGLAVPPGLSARLARLATAARSL
jgi:hypothetical protein